MECGVCGAQVGMLHGGACKTCNAVRKRAKAGDEEARAQWARMTNREYVSPQDIRAREAEMERLPVTTETMVPGVTARLGVVTGQCALGMNIFRDLTSEIRDIVGGRSGAYQKAIREAKDLCIAEMKQEAYHLGADAVIAMDLDFNEITGGGGLFGGKGMIMVVATGMYRPPVSETPHCTMRQLVAPPQDPA